MCGFIGFISQDEISKNKLNLSNDYLVCRGPDSRRDILSNTSMYNDLPYNYNFQLTFNRLSIVDLSENADQPMYSKKFNTFLMFNGEIFNHAVLRKDLEDKGLNFSTDHSDSEVVLLGLSYYGMDFISRLIGQFAISFIDLNKMKLFLIRDRVGQKPLFYSFSEKNIVFGSNLKSVGKMLSSLDVDEESLVEYFSLGVVTSPKTIYKNIFKVKPAEILEIDIGQDTVSHSKKIFWNIEDYIDNKIFEFEKFFPILENAIKIRVNADVEVANFLSGGIDSTSIVKIQTDQNIKTNTFSVGYKQGKYDESEWFEQAVDKYNTTHITKTIDGNFTNEEIISSIKIFDEPYADPSIVPSYLLSREIAKKYKVAISGDGGDELFGGYKRTMASINSSPILGNLFSKLFWLYPSKLGTGTQLRRHAKRLNNSYPAYFEDTKLLKLLNKKTLGSEKFFPKKRIENRYKMMQVFEYNLYLSELMMLKVDRTSMASSLEVRSPFVDHRLIEYIVSHNTDYIDRNEPKKLLKSILKQDFNSTFLERKKMGFVFDIESWIFNNLDYINQKVESGKIVKDLNPKIVKQLTIFKSRMNANRLWKILVLEEYLSDI